MLNETIDEFHNKHKLLPAEGGMFGSKVVFFIGNYM